MLKHHFSFKIQQSPALTFAGFRGGVLQDLTSDALISLMNSAKQSNTMWIALDQEVATAETALANAVEDVARC